MFSTDLKGKYLDSLAHNKNLEEAIKKSENINFGINLCLSFELRASDDNMTFMASLAAIIIIFFVTIFITIAPYFIQVLPLIFAIYAIETESILVISICFLILIFGIMSFLGARGFYVKCGCLYHPSNWALFVVLIDLVNIILDIICPKIVIEILKSENFESIYCLYFHILAIFYNLYRQMMLYGVFKQAYKEIREKETDIIKRCIKKWAIDENYL